MSILAIHDRLMPCGTSSARRRHQALTQQCRTCNIDGAIPEGVWRRKAATPSVRVPQVVAS